jgi:hypothetical protein
MLIDDWFADTMLVSLGGWIVVFMMRVRDAPSFESGMVSSLFLSRI